jgi:integrase
MYWLVVAVQVLAAYAALKLHALGKAQFVVAEFLETQFKELREAVAKKEPRLHDLRHTSAVHRLTSWYREGKDVQKLLPRLSVCMGHVRLSQKPSGRVLPCET